MMAMNEVEIISDSAILSVIFCSFCNSTTEVLHLGLIELQEFGKSVSGVRQQEILSNKSAKK